MTINKRKWTKLKYLGHDETFKNSKWFLNLSLEDAKLFKTCTELQKELDENQQQFSAETDAKILGAAITYEEKRTQIPPHYFVFEVIPKKNKRGKAKDLLTKASVLIKKQQEKELEDLEDLTPKEER